MKEVFVNPDEPVEIRRANAACRRIAINARRDGEEVELRHDYIKIGETVYTLDGLQKIPEKYRLDRPLGEGLDQACGGEAPDMETEANTVGEKRERFVTARRRLNPTTTQNKLELILPGERMRVTAAGLLFSGLTNMTKIPVRYPDMVIKTTIVMNRPISALRL